MYRVSQRRLFFKIIENIPEWLRENIDRWSGVFYGKPCSFPKKKLWIMWRCKNWWMRGAWLQGQIWLMMTMKPDTSVASPVRVQLPESCRMDRLPRVQKLLIFECGTFVEVMSFSLHAQNRMMDFFGYIRVISAMLWNMLKVWIFFRFRH